MPVSIDPFFVTAHARSWPDADFYVRDWTDSPTSGDNGVEPSTHPVFYLTSDVWNRQHERRPAAFNAERPAAERVPEDGAGERGPATTASCRIRRNAVGRAATVTAHFLVSPFGTRQPCTRTPARTRTWRLVRRRRPRQDAVNTGYEWHIGPTMTDHLCFAVEITAPTDPIASPSLLGHTPGWPTTDLMVLNDNNKAQRNMYPPPSSGTARRPYYALVRNGATFRRDLVLDYRAATRAC